ncbi:MAG TPA: hypothetical protein VFV17_00900, partial [Usitatibacteraceae bacterium]|nr:hypothetical protein [Usitatibacteraceae bacterium]
MLFFKRKERPEAAQDAGSIYCDPVSTNARAIFAEAGMRLVETPGEADLLWMRKGYKPWLGRLKPGQLLSHLPFEQAMTDKGLLAEHLHAHERDRAADGLALHEFYRETCCLYRDAERESFVRQLPPADTPENLWIYKPARSSRGRGIRIAWQFDDLRSFDAANPTPEQQALVAERYILQRYIRNPLL